MGVVDEDRCSGVFAADAEVAEDASMAEGEFAEPVDDVGSDSVVGGKRFAGWGGFDRRAVSLLRGCRPSARCGLYWL